MQFAIISPAAGLSRYSTLSKTHLILPQVDNIYYVKFYAGRGGEFAILDNGEYEGKRDYARLINAISIYNPNVIVLPDKLLSDPLENLAMAVTARGRLQQQFKGHEYMFVPQAPVGDITGYLEGLTRALDKGFTYFGLPRALPMKITTDLHIRANLCQWIKKIDTKLYVHALGMAAGNLEELRFLEEAGCDSIDSSAPVWRGWNGISLEESAGHTPVGDCDFEAPYHYHGGKHTLIMKNLEACGVFTNPVGHSDTASGPRMARSTNR